MRKVELSTSLNVECGAHIANASDKLTNYVNAHCVFINERIILKLHMQIAHIQWYI